METEGVLKLVGRVCELGPEVELTRVILAELTELLPTRMVVVTSLDLPPEPPLPPPLPPELLPPELLCPCFLLPAIMDIP